MDLLLYKVGRNLNRIYRTAEAFEIKKLRLYECKESYLNGNLYRAKNRVEIEIITNWPENLLALETYYPDPISKIDWKNIQVIAIGGETYGLPKNIPANQKATIPMQGQISGLTIEATIAIVLYEWRRRYEYI